MKFKKYNSIENHYRQKFLDKMLSHNQKALEDTWIAQEKLDGANIQLVFTPNEKMVVGKRSGFLEEGESFYDIWTTLEKYKAELGRIQDFVDGTKTPHRFYGELYGPGINKRVDYGTEKKIALFDAEDESGLYAQWTFDLLVRCLYIDHLMPKKFAEGKLLDVLQFDVEIGNCEGVVIKPWRENYFAGGERFIIKKKAKAFIDKEHSKKEQTGPDTFDISYNLNKEFRKYLSENRVIDTFTKHGEIQDPKQIGTYIKLILEDAKVDFLKDFDLNTLVPEMTQKQERNIFNVGGTIVELLKRYL